ncbi:hypothetical protein [Leptolyngbya sp. FACHB-17]|uniref:hypothetical protein n=1 Tax=unclassified Leptolyngbya TaxID=2650499 RepID=UPI001680EAD6|nr:hypothetical protein [Leptolyngbya sp. FACHB-17]MBD2079067.1 hypothetical protein [Leptolyngbya sp. FACHB-17]
MTETSIVYDYEQNEVRVFTDRGGVANQIEKRLKGDCTIAENRSGDRITSWNITINMKYCRNAYAIAKVLRFTLQVEPRNLC